METKNYGLIRTFDEAKERAEQDGTEYQLGAVTTDLAAVPKEHRLRYAPEGIVQFNNRMDTNGCASRSPIANWKLKYSYFYHNGMHPALKEWLKGPHMIDGKPYSYLKGEGADTRVVFDETQIEILSGTTPTGNSLKAPIHATHEHGLIPECLPLEDGMTWEQYMNPKRITKDMERLADQFMRRFGNNYEQVPREQFEPALENDVLCVAGHGWGPEINGIYQPTDAPFNHAFPLLSWAIQALDSYVPFLKLLSKKYKFFDWGYSLSITRQTPFPDETVTLFETLQRFGLLAFFAEALKRLTQTVPAPSPAPADINPTSTPVPYSDTKPTADPVPVTIPPAPHVSKLQTFCLAIKQHEGWFPGSRSYKNNNPGNCRYSSVGYASIYGHVGKDDKNFAIFKDYATGYLYLQNLVKGKIQANPNQSFYAFFEVYAPASDNNDSKHYAEVVASACGMKPTDPVSKIL